MLAEGTRLERFEIVSVIDRGGMAFVYLARQADLKRFVAIKELHAFPLGDATIVERFLREAQIGALLSHPNIVTLFETFEHDGLPYIVVEHVPRGSVRPLVGRLDTAQVAGILEGVLAGLAHAETRGVVHRDLKPENLLVADDGTIKIGDFGIAKAFHLAATLGPQLTATGTELGTPAYMSPEQGLGRDVGPWTDLYSTGVIAYELFSGRTPFGEGATAVDTLMAHVQRTPPPLGDLRPDLDRQLVEWVEWLMQKQPERRPQSAREAWDRLEDIVIDVIGPRWRRAASLAATSPTPQPKAPPTAPPEPAPDFGPASDDAFATFYPGGRQPAPPPVAEPVRQEAPPPAPE